MKKLDNVYKKQRHYFADKGPYNPSYDFFSSHVWMWELDYKESWGLKNWCFWTVVLEKTLKSHLDCKEIQPVHPKGNQSWIFIGRTDAEPEALKFGHQMWKTESLEKTLMLDKNEGRRRRGLQRMRWLDGITDSMDMFSSVAQSCLTLWDPMDCSMPGFPVHHQLLELTQTHVHWVCEGIQPSNPLLSPSPPTFNLFQHEGLFKWVREFEIQWVLEFQLQHQSFQWIFRTDFL